MSIPLIVRRKLIDAASTDTTTTLRSVATEFDKAVSLIVAVLPTAFSGTIDIQGRQNADESYRNLLYVDITAPYYPLSVGQLSYTLSSTQKDYLVPVTMPDMQVVMTATAGTVTVQASGYGVSYPLPTIAGGSGDRAVIANDPSPAFTINQHSTGDILELQDASTMVWQVLDGGVFQAANDISIGFGSSSGADALIRFSTADASDPAMVIALDNTSQQLHITDKGAIATDWARAAGTHPELAIHSNTTPATDYLAIGNHDGSTAYIDVVGGATLQFNIAGTGEVTITASATSPATTDSNALGTTTKMWSDLFLASAGVINFNNGDVTVTHAAAKLTVDGAALVWNEAGADLDARIEGDNNANLFAIDAGLNGGVGQVAIGRAAAAGSGFFIGFPALTAPADANWSIIQVGPAGSVTIPAGLTPAVASLIVFEPNITATGTVTAATTVYIASAPTEGSTNSALWVNGVVRLDGNLQMDNAANDLLIKAATAAALEISDGTTKFLAFDTRVTTDNVVAIAHTGSAPTFASAAGSTYSLSKNAAVTITLTGGVGVTAMDGLSLYLDAVTLTSASATAVSTASAFYIKKVVAAGAGPVAITNNYLVNTDTAGCYCTAAGVWTSTSTFDLKHDIEDATVEDVETFLEALRPRKYRYNDPSDGNFLRLGVGAEEAPDAIAMPGHKGIGAVHEAGAALAAVKYLWQENKELKARIVALEARR